MYDKLEREEMDVIFDVMDHHRTGRLSLHDIISGFCFMCKASAQEKLRFLFKAYDTSNNGTLEREEVAAMIRDVRVKNEVLQNAIAARAH